MIRNPIFWDVTYLWEYSSVLYNTPHKIVCYVRLRVAAVRLRSSCVQLRSGCGYYEKALSEIFESQLPHCQSQACVRTRFVHVPPHLRPWSSRDPSGRGRGAKPKSGEGKQLPLLQIYCPAKNYVQYPSFWYLSYNIDTRYVALNYNYLGLVVMKPLIIFNKN